MIPNQMLAALKKADSFIEKIEGGFLVAILGTMVVVAFSQVVLRNFFSTALSWGDGLTRAMVLWSGLIGASIAVKQGRYISIDSLSRMMSPKVKRISRGVIYFFSMGVCYSLGTAAVAFVRQEHEAGTRYSIGVDSWIVELIIPVIFFFLCFRFFLKLLCLFAGEELEKPEWER